MMFGCGETFEQRANHLEIVRQIQQTPAVSRGSSRDFQRGTRRSTIYQEKHCGRILQCWPFAHLPRTKHRVRKRRAASLSRLRFG